MAQSSYFCLCSFKQIFVQLQHCFHCYLFFSFTSENTYSNLCAKSTSFHCRCM